VEGLKTWKVLSAASKNHHESFKMKLLFKIFLLLLVAPLTAQNARRLALAEAVELAKARSIAARQAATTKETRYWEYRTFQSNYKPQLVLSGNLPSFNRSFREVWQPNGTVLFQPVRNNNSSFSLSLEQNIARTGGTIFATTQLQRFDDFDRNTTLYNGTPLAALGLSQPLFRFNNLKWDNKIEPLKYDESRREYVEDLEQIGQSACNLYFDLLLAQVNLNIAQTNAKNTADILKIANEKFELGKTSRNELLQLQLEQLKAQKAVATALRDVEIAGLKLRSFIGLQDTDKLDLEEPQPQNPPEIDPARLLEEAFANRADAIAFSRRKLEADRGVAKAKGDNGVNATLAANLGFANSSARLNEVVQGPQNYQSVQLQLDVPILDWGRSKSRIKTAEANRQLVEYAIEQDRQNFQQEIYTSVTLYNLLKNQLGLTAQADQIAQEQYKIAQERYLLGNLDVTDLSFAFAEKDRAKRDYIGALRDYWAAYFNLRRLTLYDFEKGLKVEGGG
jgi:outer membrane protein